MTVFVVQPENPLKFGVLIDAFHDGARVPALLVSGMSHDASSDLQGGFPAPAHGVAGNVASLLNNVPVGEMPSSSGNTAIHFRRHAHGVTLQHRDVGGGVSVPGLNITVLETLPKAHREAVLAQITPGFMASLCASINTGHGDQHPSGPQQKQGLRP